MRDGLLAYAITGDVIKSNLTVVDAYAAFAPWLAAT